MAKQRLRVWQRFELSDVGGTIAKGGELSDEPPKVIEVDGLVHDQMYPAIAAAATQKVYDSTQDIATFKFMWIEVLTSDGAGVEVEIVYGTANKVVYTETMRQGFQKPIASQDGRDSTHTEDWGVNGVANLLSKVTVKNFGSNDASVRIFAVD